MRVYALSDVHVDHSVNMSWVRGLSRRDFQDDALILAGDVSHLRESFEAGLEAFRERFARVFFVPGNHDLWLGDSPFADSIAKFHHLLERCAALGVETGPARAGEVWVVPLFSWYERPEEGDESLFLPKKGEDPDFVGWSDDHFTRWPAFDEGDGAARYFLRLNEPRVARPYDAPVVSFSHFLPRRELMFPTPEEDAAAGSKLVDPHRPFNFSRVAGTWGLDRQIRRLGARLHVYGHQHRNRDRAIDGVVYVSHCLGYRRERKDDLVRFLGDGPRQVWPLEE